MGTAIRTPENKSEITKALVWIHGSVSRAALKYMITDAKLRNILNGQTPFSNNLDLVKRINADTGADLKAWEK